MPTFPVCFHRFGVDSVPVKMDSVPDDIVLLIFSNLDWRDKMSCSQVCKVWNRLIVSECTQAWHVASKDVLPTSSLNFDLIRTLAPKDKIRAFYCGFGKDTVSDNMYVMPNGFTVHRKPVAQSSDMARGRVGFSDGIHHWIVRWETKSLGSSAGVGVCTKNAKLHGEGYYTLVGEDNHSWGWDIVRMNLRHEGQSLQQFPPQGGSKISIGDEIGIVLDADRGTLSFEFNSVFLGTAFRDLPHATFYPCISAVYGDSEISLVYCGWPMIG